MKKFFKSFIATNLSLLIALSLITAPIQDNHHPISPTNNLTGQKGETN